MSKASWNKLIKLELSNNFIGDRGFKHLTETPWKNIKTFTFEYNPISLQSVKMLYTTLWNDLKEIDMNYLSSND